MLICKCLILVSCFPFGLQSCFQAIWSFLLFKISLPVISKRYKLNFCNFFSGPEHRLNAAEAVWLVRTRSDVHPRQRLQHLTELTERELRSHQRPRHTDRPRQQHHNNLLHDSGEKNIDTYEIFWISKNFVLKKITIMSLWYSLPMKKSKKKKTEKMHARTLSLILKNWLFFNKNAQPHIFPNNTFLKVVFYPFFSLDRVKKQLFHKKTLFYYYCHST